MDLRAAHRPRLLFVPSLLRSLQALSFLLFPMLFFLPFSSW
jgi:hypothetical protein